MDLTGLNREIDAFEDFFVAYVRVQVLNFEHCLFLYEGLIKYALFAVAIRYLQYDFEFLLIANSK